VVGLARPAGCSRRLTLVFLRMGLGGWGRVSLGWSRLKTGQWIPFDPVRRGVPAASASA
jgi:hypothetical protein